jgi:L-alanine-DL-glutamate epimerase-like enolase superfamily enzyme
VFDENSIEKNLIQLHSHQPENYFAKAAIDIALHDWHSKAQNISVHSFLKINSSPLSEGEGQGERLPFCTFTIGFDTDEIIKQKIKEATDFTILKIKLGTSNDKKFVKTIRTFTDKPICVDVNQGWKNADEALDMISFLKENNCLFVEQPLPKNLIEEQKKLFKKSPLPIIADEALQTLDDLMVLKDFYHGINVKLMKCGGISKAKELIEVASQYNLKILIGCMSESSCGVSAAAQLSSLANWVDLDGPLLISNDPYTGVNYSDGKILLSDKSGLGIATKLKFS